MIEKLKNISYLYVALVIISFLTSFVANFPSFDEVGHLQEGCYWTNALVGYIECRGLLANNLIEFFLNYWMKLIYIVLFLFSGWSLHLLLLALLMWSPIFYLVWYFVKGKHLSRKTTRY